MKIAVFTPFGSLSRESGIIYLLANYLQRIYPETLQLRCNGVFSICDRDGERSWKRSADSCLSCACDQEKLAAWSGIRSTCLSRYLAPREVDETRRWVLAGEDEKLQVLRFRENALYPFCLASFKSRFGVEPDCRNKNHLHFLRRLMLSSARFMVACERFNKKFLPDLSLVPGGDDYLSALFVQKTKSQGGSPAVFRWDLHSRTITITNPRTSDLYSCDLFLENVTTLRPDAETWPRELLKMISDIVIFLGMSDTQLALPMAR